MWLAFYNPTGIGNVLLLTSGEAKHTTSESKEDVTVVYDFNTHEVVGVNIFGVEDLAIQGNGSIQLTSDQLQAVQQRINQAGFDVSITVDPSEKFVAGYVESCKPVPDSDHLSVTQTNVGGETLQIVCGADNIQAGMTVLVAKPGAVMPNGGIIWPGQLRGVDSQGMICSTRELGLEHLEDYPGIWELASDIEPGTGLDAIVARYK